ncbi:hypothetical protein K7W42_02940 [Deinococcus sp. HMF7604]|uniref:hypothetical protein n=1 Tax=Deinococcus betulae TaxID=2873312 RepID=UPI001CCE635E|nr:hypothetical protein [Deinococcus betulae]MBZ9749813.1 hypothetical protein [Deinococcus betulae]
MILGGKHRDALEAVKRLNPEINGWAARQVLASLVFRGITQLDVYLSFSKTTWSHQRRGEACSRLLIEAAAPAATAACIKVSEESATAPNSQQFSIFVMAAKCHLSLETHYQWPELCAEAKRHRRLPQLHSVKSH